MSNDEPELAPIIGRMTRALAELGMVVDTPGATERDQVNYLGCALAAFSDMIAGAPALFTGDKGAVEAATEAYRSVIRATELPYSRAIIAFRLAMYSVLLVPEGMERAADPITDCARLCLEAAGGLLAVSSDPQLDEDASKFLKEQTLVALFCAIASLGEAITPDADPESGDER